MKSKSSHRLEYGLQAALEKLRALDDTDRDKEWVVSSEVLGWLYQCEEAERMADPAYYQHRASSSGGQTLAGLIWLRGQLVHHQAEVQDIVLVKTKVYISIGEKWVPATVEMFYGGKLIPITPRLAAPRWPSRAKLPDQKLDRYGRDTLYQQHIEGQELRPPLEKAAQYLVSR